LQVRGCRLGKEVGDWRLEVVKEVGDWELEVVKEVGVGRRG
jgi:hypothetical protein